MAAENNDWKARLLRLGSRCETAKGCRTKHVKEKQRPLERRAGILNPVIEFHSQNVLNFWSYSMIDHGTISQNSANTICFFELYKVRVRSGSLAEFSQDLVFAVSLKPRLFRLTAFSF